MFPSAIVAGPVVVGGVDAYGSSFAIVVREDRITAHNLSDTTTGSTSSVWTVFDTNYTQSPVVLTSGLLALPSLCSGWSIDLYNAANGTLVKGCGPPYGGGYPLLGTDGGLVMQLREETFYASAMTADPAYQFIPTACSAITGSFPSPTVVGAGRLFTVNTGYSAKPTEGFVSVMPEAGGSELLFLGPTMPFGSNPVLDVVNGVLITGSMDGNVYGFDAASSTSPGRVLWSLTNQNEVAVKALALTPDGTLVVAGDGSLCGFVLPSNGTFPSPTPAWCINQWQTLLGRMTARPIVGADGTIYAGE